MLLLNLESLYIRQDQFPGLRSGHQLFLSWEQSGVFQKSLLKTETHPPQLAPVHEAMFVQPRPPQFSTWPVFIGTHLGELSPPLVAVLAGA